MKRLTLAAPKSLKELVFFSWFIPGVLAGLASLLAFGIVGYVDHRNAIDRVAGDLTELSRQAARRLSGEILLGKNGAVLPVAEQFRKEHGLQSILILSSELNCSHWREVGSDRVCVVEGENSILLSREIPGILEKKIVLLSREAPLLRESLRPAILLWSALPLFLVMGLGLWIQRAYLRRYFVRPIEALVETSVHAKEPPAQWLREFREISRNLSDSIEGREQAVFGQLARGVVHDLKTLIHSIATAADMVQEHPEGSEKRARRIEVLLRAISTNIPKIQTLIEQTLDGSREIPIRVRTADLAVSLRNSIDLNREMAAKQGVSLEYEGPSSRMSSFDPVQIERAFVNVIKNAIEAFEASDKQDVRRVRVGLCEVNPQVSKVQIEDSGPGLPETPEQVFKSLRSSKVHGSGLGLLITRRIIQAHGGRIIAGRSEDLRGAKFEIQFPESREQGGLA